MSILIDIMTKTKIPVTVQELLNEFIRYNFYKIEYKRLARALEKNVDTIIQRVKRNKECLDPSTIRGLLFQCYVFIRILLTFLIY